MPPDNVDLVRQFQDAFNRRDRETLMTLTHPDFEFIPILAVLEGHVYRGREELLAWVDGLEHDWEVFEICPREYRDLGDRVLCFGHWRARGRTSGVELEGQPGAWLVDVRDGLLVRSETFTDRSDAIAAAGLTE